MGKTVVLDEAEYLELLHQASVWKAQFKRCRDRDRDLETRLKESNAEKRQLKKKLAVERQEHAQKIRALQRKLGEL